VEVNNVHNGSKSEETISSAILHHPALDEAHRHFAEEPSSEKHEGLQRFVSQGLNRAYGLELRNRPAGIIDVGISDSLIGGTNRLPYHRDTVARAGVDQY